MPVALQHGPHEITVCLSPEVIAALQERADFHDTSIQLVAQRAIEEALGPGSAETQRLKTLNILGVYIV